MKIKTIFIVLFAFPSLLIGSIIETSQFGDILLHIEDPILIVCDIDNTLLRASQHLGSVAWGDNIIAQLERKGVSQQEAREIESIVWKAVQPHIKVESVDPHAPHVVHEIQRRNIPILGLTARSFDESECTINQLLSIGIHLLDSYSSEFLFLEGGTAFYEKNVLFCSLFNKKSTVLFTFLDKHSIHPECILFVDDKLSHVEDVERACKERGIDYVGIRFSGADESVKNFDPRLAHIQWEAFPFILSDEQAQSMLRNEYSLYPNR